MRVDNWPSRLALVVADAERMPFGWGVHDCAIFARNCQVAVTGKDRFGDLFGGYKTALGAARRIKRAGFDDIEGLLSAHLPEVPVNFAQRGDVAVVDAGHGATLAVMLGETVALPGLDGLARYPRALVRRAWRVG